MRFVGFVGPSYTLRSVNVDCQRCINLYPEMNELGTGKEREVAALVSTPGLQTKLTLPTAPVRAVYTASTGDLYAVGGNKLYSISSTWTATEIGTLLTATGQVGIADNGLHLVVVDGGYGYAYTFASSLFAQITDPEFPGADQVTFQDGYFIFNKPNSEQFFISGLRDITFDSLDIATAEGAPDKLVGLISDHRDLWLFGETTTEVFYNSGNNDFPFERVQGAFIEHGCGARWSIAKMANTTYWVSKDDKGAGIVFRARGYQPERISTHALEYAISTYGDITDTVAWTYQDGGHFFYCLNFPTAKTTWVYDTTTSLWHERCYNNQGSLERHRANSHAFAYATHVVGDYATGQLYAMSNAYYADDSAEIMRRRVTPHLSSGLKRVFYSSFQLDMETGTGIDGLGQGEDPQAMLQFSDDGGHSWSNEKWTSFGKIGQKKRRAIWRRLGQSRDRVYRVTITDPVKVVIIGAEIDTAAGVS